MFRNYMVTALRSFWRHKLYSFINIVGLTIGLTCTIFVILLVRDELSYDKWIPGTENLYRVSFNVYPPGQRPIHTSTASFPVPGAMQAEIPEVKAIAHLEARHMTVTVGERQFDEEMDVVSPDFFQVIRLPLVAGDPATVFRQPDSVVLSQAEAVKLFGHEPAVGKNIIVSGGQSNLQPHALLVTGIARDIPHNSQLTGVAFFPNTSIADPMSQERKQHWMDQSGWGYVQLAPGADVQAVTEKLKTIIDRNVDPMKLANLPIRGSTIMSPYLTPFRDDHLTSDNYGSLTPPGSWTMVYGFAAIGLLILLVACFNFTNLATAQATVRAREISLRKVLGARRAQLVVQFLAESVLTALIALILALALTEALLPIFDRMVGKPIAFHYLSDWFLVLSLVGMAVLAGLVGGAYPALVLSGFRPARVLRTNAARQSGSGKVRTLLVVLQFAVSIGLGIAAMVVFQQIAFARAVELGFNKDRLVIVNGNGLPETARDSFLRALAVNADIAGVAISDDVPFSGNRSNMAVQLPGSSAALTMRYVTTSPEFLKVYDIHLLSGRDLSRSRGADVGSYDGKSFNVLLNATAAKQLGFSPAEALGKIVTRLPGPDHPQGRATLTVVGVVDDFKIDGAKLPVAPTAYLYVPSDVSEFSIKVRAANLPATLAFIDRTWHAFAPSVAIRRHFLNRDFENDFLAEQQQGKIFALFVGVAIFIAAMGLFGLAAFSTERRTKEIGIRKSFGARAMDIVLMLLWQFSLPVLAANLIAWPVAYYYLRHWLEGYAYRISLNPLYFLGAGLAALLIAWATVFVHARRVARANPIHALRYE